MERKAVITIVEHDVGDGIHHQLAIQTEFFPPHVEGEQPSMAHMAAVVGLEAIANKAMNSGGGVQYVETRSAHRPEWGV